MSAEEQVKIPLYNHIIRRIGDNNPNEAVLKMSAGYANYKMNKDKPQYLEYLEAKNNESNNNERLNDLKKEIIKIKTTLKDADDEGVKKNVEKQ